MQNLKNRKQLLFKTKKYFILEKAISIILKLKIYFSD